MPAWEVASAFGLTDLDLDLDPPGSMISFFVGKRLVDRVSFGLEAGSGFVGKTATCDLGGLQVECLKDSWWPMLDATLNALDGPGAGELYFFRMTRSVGARGTAGK